MFYLVKGVIHNQNILYNVMWCIVLFPKFIHKTYYVIIVDDVYLGG